jgi:rod shape-determining protein MreC
MKNILLFVYRNHVFFLFLILEVTALALVVRNNEFHRASMLNSSNRLTGNIYQLNSEVTEYLKLKTVNTRLAEENAALRALLAESQYDKSRMMVSVTDSSALQQYTYIPAKVVNGSTNRRNNYFTINKGLLQGVEPEMAVITSDGIVGIVKDVSKNYASVLSILHKNSSISVKLAGTGYIGSLVWDGGSPKRVQLTDIPNHVELYEGMEVVTSGYSAMFPSGIKVGKIISFDIGPGENFYDIEVETSNDLSSVSIVYVVNNLMRIEQIELEQHVEANDQ